MVLISICEMPNFGYLWIRFRKTSSQTCRNTSMDPVLIVPFDLLGDPFSERLGQWNRGFSTRKPKNAFNNAKSYSRLLRQCCLMSEIWVVHILVPFFALRIASGSSRELRSATDWSEQCGWGCTKVNGRNRSCLKKNRKHEKTHQESSRESSMFWRLLKIPK